MMQASPDIPNLAATPTPRRWLGCSFGCILAAIIGGSVIAVIGCVVGIFLLVGPASSSFLSSQFGITTAALPTGTDPTRFDPVASYPAVLAFAGDGAELLEFEARYVRADGTMDLNASYGSASPRTTYKFALKLAAPPTNAPPVGAGGGEGKKWYQPVAIEVYEPGQRRHISSSNSEIDYTNEGMERDTSSVTNSAYQPAPTPACSLKNLWSVAIENGAPRDAVAVISYDAKGYTFSISDINVQLYFGLDCKHVESLSGDSVEPAPTVMPPVEPSSP